MYLDLNLDSDLDVDLILRLSIGGTLPNMCRSADHPVEDHVEVQAQVQVQVGGGIMA